MKLILLVAVLLQFGQCFLLEGLSSLIGWKLNLIGGLFGGLTGGFGGGFGHDSGSRQTRT